jgi:hypothetical protein
MILGLFLVFAFAVSANTGPAVPAATVESSRHEFVDLGPAPAGTVDLFEVDAHNASCDEPQDFHFVAHDLPWLKFYRGQWLRDVERGRTKTFLAVIDLTGLKPGRYRGSLEIECETCGQFVLSRCSIDKTRVTIQVDVIAQRR